MLEVVRKKRKEERGWREEGRQEEEEEEQRGGSYKQRGRIGWEFGKERQGEEKGRMGAGKREFEKLKLRREEQLTFMGEPSRCRTLS